MFGRVETGGVGGPGQMALHCRLHRKNGKWDEKQSMKLSPFLTVIPTSIGNNYCGMVVVCFHVQGLANGKRTESKPLDLFNQMERSFSHRTVNSSGS